jgi:hypothetical protein
MKKKIIKQILNTKNGNINGEDMMKKKIKKKQKQREYGERKV